MNEPDALIISVENTFDNILIRDDDIFETTKSDNKDINEYSCIKGTTNGITYDEKVINSEKSKEEVAESYYDFNFINENPLVNKIIKTDVLKIL